MKRIISIVLMFCMIFTVSFPAVEAEETTNTYYVSDVYGTDTNSGLSESAPFKTLERALELVEPGGNIYIMDNIQVADASNDDAPLVIDKNITIQGDSTTMPLITLHAGGIILGADVTFTNLKLGTASFLRPGIAANGHALTLDNVHQDESLRPLQIYGGTFFDAATKVDYGNNYRGASSNIVICGGSYEAVYAGSSNGDIPLYVTLTVEKGNGLSMDGIYAGNTVKDPNDTTQSGQTPVLDSSLALTGLVNITVSDNAPVRIIDGVAKSHSVDLTLNISQRYAYIIKNIDTLSVMGGTFAPASGSSFAENEDDGACVMLMNSGKKKAVLDLSDCSYPGGIVYLKQLTSSGDNILVLPTDTVLNLKGFSSSGKTVELRVAGGMPWSSAEEPGYSGWMEYGVTYVNRGIEGDGTFVISHPYPTQTDITFTTSSSNVNGWTTVAEEVYAPAEVVSLVPKDVTASYVDANTAIEGIGGINIEAEVTYSDKTIEEYSDDLSFVPIDYKVIYTNLDGEVIEGVLQSSWCDGAGYYTCEYLYPETGNAEDKVWMTFTPAGDSINVCKGEDGLKAGIYTIEMRLETTTGIVTKKCTITVMTEDGELPDVHVHEWSEAWSSDVNYHWHDCVEEDCSITENSGKKGYEEHHGGVATCINKAACVDCGVTYGTIRPGIHEGEKEFRNKKEPTATEPGYSGDLYCLSCGEVVQYGGEIPATGSEDGDDIDGGSGSTGADSGSTGGDSGNTEVEGGNTGGDSGNTGADGESTGSDSGSTDGNSENTGADTESVRGDTGNKVPLAVGDSVVDADTKLIYTITYIRGAKKEVACSGLHDNASTKVTIPNTIQLQNESYKVTSIANRAFKGNKKLTAVKIGDNVKVIGKEAFSGCKNLKTIKSGKNVTTIGDKAFYNCVKITSITIPSKVSKIGKQAFYKCKKLKKIIIKTSRLTKSKVGKNAFKGIKSDATIKVPKKKVNTYTQMLRARGVGKKVTIKK